MAKVKFIRVATNAEVENIDIVDGQFIVTGEGKTFVDFENERKSIAGTPDTEMSDVSTNSVENKVVKEYIDEKIASKTNYKNDITDVLTSLSFNGNTQQIIKDDSGLVTINLTFNLTQNINFSSYQNIFTLPEEVRPPGNAIINVTNFEKNGFGFIQSTTGQVRVKFGSSINSGQELNITGSYYITD